MSRMREPTCRTMSTAMQLPNVPRISDDKSRWKYAVDYDKYEPELRKHHLGGSMETNIVSLKDISADFDRVVPSLVEPTVAERDYDNALRERRRKEKMSRSPFAARSAVAMAQRKSVVPKEAQHPDNAQRSQLGDESPGGAAAQGLASVTAPPIAITADQSSVQSSNSAQPRKTGDTGEGGQGQATERGESLAVLTRPTSASGSATAIAAASSSTASRPRSARGRNNASITNSISPTGDRPSPNTSRNTASSPSRFTVPSEASTENEKTPRPASAVSMPAPPAKSPTAVSPRPQRPTAAGTTLVKQSAPARTQPPTSGAITRPRTTAPTRPLRTTATTSRPQTTAAAAIRPAATTSVAPTSRAATYTQRPPRLPTLRLGVNSSVTTAEGGARILRVLLDPPDAYLHTLHLDLQSIDLQWLRDGATPSRHLTSLADYRVPAESGSDKQREITSPRSVLVLLRSGVAMEDLQATVEPSDLEAATQPLMGKRPDAETQKAVLQRLTQQRRAQSEALLNALVREYNSFCSQVQLDSLIAAYHRVVEEEKQQVTISEEDQASMATAVLLRQERQHRVFESNKIRMLREVQQAREAHDRHVIAEERHREAEAEAELLRTAKAKEREEQRQRQQERLEARREEREAREEVYKQLLEERLTKASERSDERARARERQVQARHAQRLAREEERQRRISRNMAVVAEQAVALEKKREEKDARLVELRQEREARLQEEHTVLHEKQARAARQREEAKARAQDVEDQLRIASEEAFHAAEVRYEEFRAHRQEAVAERIAREAQHQQRLEELRDDLFKKYDSIRTATIEKHRRCEENWVATQKERLVNLMWKRETELEQARMKTYSIRQQQRVAEFQKLQTVVNLMAKRRAADVVVRQREVIYEQAMRDRVVLREERETLKELAKQEEQSY